MEDGIAALEVKRPIDLIGYHTGAAIAVALATRGRLAIRRIMLVAVPVFSEAERASFGALSPIAFDEAGDWAREEWRRSWRWRSPGQSRSSVLRGFAEKMRPGARERGATAIAAYD
jgi:pimeloyl-ACP methyl ester carboxylesterase